MEETREKSTISERVFNYFMDEISSGRWPVGGKIPSENQLCSQLNVSRISVRSAIYRLSALGLLKSRQGSGTYVCGNIVTMPMKDLLPTVELKQNDKLSLLEFRKVMEVASAGYAAQRITTELADRMLESIVAMEDADVTKDIAAADYEFHWLIAEATQNPFIMSVYEILGEAYLKMFDDNISFMGKRGTECHKKILTAIEMRDSDAAQGYMLEHLNNTAHEIIISGRLNREGSA